MPMAVAFRAASPAGPGCSTTGCVLSATFRLALSDVASYRAGPGRGRGGSGRGGAAPS
ncbi:MAG TPA: hypothetical protein VMF65_00250 [Acidimicrobiales bacterium]|nr:hypothetical protein [Acidimicrobiales bacterium]